MAADGVSKIIIGADVDEALKGLKDVGTQATGTGLTINQLKDKITELTEKMNNASGTDIRVFATQIKGMQDAIKEATTVATPAAEGFEKIKVAFEDLGRAATGEGFGLRSIASNFSLLGPEITIAVAAVGFFISKVLEADNAQKELNKTLGESSASVQGESAEMLNLVKIATDLSNTTEVRKGAYDRINDMYPGYLKNLSFEKSSYDDLKAAVDKITGALVRQAEVKAVVESISDVYKELNKNVAEGGTTFEKIISVGSGVVNALDHINGGIKGVTQGFKDAKDNSISHSLGEDSVEAGKKIDVLTAKLAELQKQQIENNDNQLKDPPKTTDTKVQDDNLSYLKQAAKLTEDLSKQSSQPLFEQFQQSAQGALGLLNFKIYEENLKKATADAAKGAITADTFKEYTDAARHAFDKTANPNLTTHVSTELETEPDVESIEQANKAIDNIGKHTKPLPLHLVIAGFDQDIAKETAKPLKQLQTTINDTLTQGISAGVSGVAESIGTAIGDGGNVFAAAGQAIISGLGDLIESLGKALIEWGVAQEAVQLAVGTFSPLGAIAAGAAVVAAGAAIKSASTPSVPKLAEGGIATSRMFAEIGEGGQPEAVVPLDRLQHMINMPHDNVGQSSQQIYGVLNGNDLYLTNNRNQQSQRKVS